MLIDHRTYRILPGRVPAQLDLYGKLAYPVQLRYMGEPLCYLVAESGALILSCIAGSMRMRATASKSAPR